MTTYSTTHEGLERIVDGAHAVSRIVGPARGMRMLPTFVLTGFVAGAVAVITHKFGDLFGDGLTAEWLSLWVLASLAILVFAKTAMSLSFWLGRQSKRFVAYMQQEQEAAYLESELRRDPRLRADFIAAQLRAEQEAGRF